jgi:hypothetical protein
VENITRSPIRAIWSKSAWRAEARRAAEVGISNNLQDIKGRQGIDGVGQRHAPVGIG